MYMYVSCSAIQHRYGDKPPKQHKQHFAFMLGNFTNDASAPQFHNQCMSLGTPICPAIICHRCRYKGTQYELAIYVTTATTGDKLRP